MRFNSKIQKLKATKLFASLEETFLGLEKSSTWDVRYFVTKEDEEACSGRFHFETCEHNRARRTMKNQSKNYIDKLLDSLLAVDIDYAKTVKKQDEETKKLKKQIENLQNSSDNEEELECKLVDNGGGKGGDKESEGSTESGYEKHLYRVIRYYL